MKKINILAVLLLTFTFFLGNSTSVFATDNISILGKYSIQKKYTMYLGTNDKDTLNQIIPTEQIRNEMHEICMKYVDGYTMSVVEGFYRNSNNGISHETTLIYVFIDMDINAIQKIMDEALVKFNQECILLEENDSKSIFYSYPQKK